jgi:uncharacterized iron-regulated membrane protein
MTRLLIFLHRYLGIAIGWLMAMWCLSGMVMMYVAYPELDPARRLEALPPISWEGCCAIAKIGTALNVSVADSFTIERVGDRPILRVAQASAQRAFDLQTGDEIALFDRNDALKVSARYGASSTYAEEIDRDQWTVSEAFNHDRPLHRVALNDAQGTELYVSSKTGTVVQLTTRTQRLWNWVGTVPHWLYPTLLRRHAGAWTQTVIWLSLAGVFLTVMGLYIGIVKWRAMHGASLSPYRGVHLWHHVTGLFFGILTLTWVGSGLASMSPWGLFEGGNAREERDQVRDVWIDGGQIAAMLTTLASKPLPFSAARIESAPFAGKLFLLAYEGLNTRRFDAKTLTAMPLTQPEIERVAARLAPGKQISVSLLSQGDNYYYSGHDRVELPVYRLTLDDSQHTRLYLSAKSGDVVGKVDAGQRRYRWWFEALHRWDFNAMLRQRPWWDFLVAPLMIGVTIVCCTGVYIGFRRLLRK